MSHDHDDAPHESHGPRKILEACREITSRDPGIRSELDFARQMSWILLLKVLDERERESKGRESIVPCPYRWRDWAADPEGTNGDELVEFLVGEDVELPDHRRGPGLFAALRGLQGVDGGDLRDVVAQTFAAASNRMTDGYLLRDVLLRVDGMHVSSPSRARQLADQYEELLERVRDAWIDEGTVHTPRALVELVVRTLRPLAHEVVLDPSCGDAGFLRAAHDAMTSDLARVSRASDAARAPRLEGSEPSPLAFLLGATNLLLHGAEMPAIYNEDALAVRLSQSGHDRSADVILSTLPRGDVESGVASAFPRDLRTHDAALLHLQLALRRLRRPGHGSTRGGRAALIVPDHVLSCGGAGARIRARLLEEADVHTIVRLPPGVFAPASDVATSILFFERGRPTRDIWYYQHPLPEHRRQVKEPRYTRGRGLRLEEFLPLLEWWDRRVENDFAWKVPVRDLLEYDARGEVARCDLDRSRVVRAPVIAQREARPVPETPRSPATAQAPATFAIPERRDERELRRSRSELEELAELDGFGSRGPLEELGDLEEFHVVTDGTPPATAEPVSSRAPRAKEPDAPLRVTVPPVIDRPDLMGPGRRAASSALFLFTWVLWVFVWLPLLTALAWYLGFLRFRDQVWDEGLDSLLSFLRFYGIVVGSATLVLLAWSLYNQWRYGGRQNRRHPGSPLGQDQLARDFGVEPETLERVQSARVVWIDVSPSGSVLDARARPLQWHHEPASEAWNTPEPEKAPEPSSGTTLARGPFDDEDENPWSVRDARRRDP